MRMQRGFTLLEMLMVAAIIAVLLGLVGGVGIAVVAKQKVRQTEFLLQTLDRALDEYITVVGAIPPYIASDYERVPGPSNDPNSTDFFAMYQSVRHPKRPDAAVFLKQAMGVGDVQSIVRGIPAQFLAVTRGGEGGNEDSGDQDVTPSVQDVWASKVWSKDRNGNLWDITSQQLIYYVHPDNTLAQELYGRCVNRRPYFFSAGPDLKYGLRTEIEGANQATIESLLKDNVYSYPVGPINTEASFFSAYR